MELIPVLGWLVDDAAAVSGVDRFLAELGERLIAGGLPLVSGALTLAAPHPIVTRRVCLWRADTGEVIEALGFGSLAAAGDDQANVGHDWLAEFESDIVEMDVASAPRADAAVHTPSLGWAVRRHLTDAELDILHDVARFAAAPLDVLATRSTLATLLETYLGRRSAAQVLAGRLGRETGETIRAVLLNADLRGFTELSEASAPDAVVAALDAWFDRIAGAVHAFGGEVLKYIGDGMLAIFPINDRSTSEACDAALRAVAAARAGMAHLDLQRVAQNLPPLPFGMALHVGDMLWGNIGTADRLDFTAIGSAVNLVSRLEGLCRPLGRVVLASGAFAAETTSPMIPLGEHRLRGIARPCAVFAPPD
jgi:class 3 adenylate cyclase